MFWVQNRQMPPWGSRAVGDGGGPVREGPDVAPHGEHGRHRRRHLEEGAPDVTEALEETAAAVSTGPSLSALQSVSNVLQLTTERSEYLCLGAWPLASDSSTRTAV